MPYGKTNSYRRRPYRRTYRPKARTSVDRQQNKRIKKLEKKPEVKYVAPFQVGISNTRDIGTNGQGSLPVVKQQIRLIPDIVQGTGKQDRIGESINVKSITVKFRLDNPGGTTHQRYILLMDNRPTQMTADYTGKSVRQENILPWDNILEHYASPTPTFPIQHVISPFKQDVYKSNRFSVLMDHVLKRTTNGCEPVEWTFHRSYKDLKLKFSDEATENQPFNKRLILCYLSTEAPGGTNPQFSYSTMIRYTDS